MITLLELAACVSALGTIVAPSLVIAVLLLVGTFLATGVWLLIVGSGFVGIAYLLVYIGAIAILFLFVVMLMDLRDLKAASTGNSDNTLPLALLSGILVLGLTQLGNADGSSWIYPTGVSFVAGQDLLVESNTQLLAIGSLLFQEGTLPLIIAAVLLLVAIIGPLTLCLPKNNLSSNHIVVIIFLL